MARKMSAYARRMQRTQHAGTFNGAEWLNVIQRCRSFDEAEPIPGSWVPSTASTAAHMEQLARDALARLINGQVGAEETDPFDHLAHAVGVAMVRDLRGVIEREKADLGVLLTLTPPKSTMIAEAAAAGQHVEPGFTPVPRLQIVTIEDAMALRERAVQLPARRADSFRRAPREEDRSAQGRLEL
jgi:hypothetical protein